MEDMLVGNVRLNLSSYTGTDQYCDGKIEQEMLVFFEDEEDIADRIKTDNRWPVLYHMSPERENLLDWVKFPEKAKVLEIGAGCGALTGILCEKSQSVVSADLSLFRSKINATRNKQRNNLEIRVGNILDMDIKEKYDVVTLIGVLEYAEIFVHGDDPFAQMLNWAVDKLSENGILLLAIENQFGIKYFSGAREDHSYRLYDGIEGYLSGSGAKTFSRKGLDRLLKSVGLESREFFYPFPDYKFPRQIFFQNAPEYFEQIDDYFPNFGEYAYVGADQGKVLRNLAGNGMFEELSNSFLTISCRNQMKLDQPVYVKHASQRSRQYALRTEISANRGSVIKKPIFSDGIAHIRNIKSARDILSTDKHSFTVIDCKAMENELWFPFMQGIRYGDKLTNSDKTWNSKQPAEMIVTYKQWLMEFAGQEPVKWGEDKNFEAVFGKSFTGEGICVNPAPLDFHFDNLLISNGKCCLIDPEWVVNAFVPVGFIAWRAVQLLFEQYSNTERTVLEEIRRIVYTAFNICDDEIKVYKKMEVAFHDHVFGASSLKEQLNNYIVGTPSLTSAVSADPNYFVSTIYGTSGENAFSADCAVTALLPAGSKEFELKFDLTSMPPCSRLRFDPLEAKLSRFWIKKSFFITGQEIVDAQPSLWSNNAVQDANGDLFETLDPMYFIDNIPQNASEFVICGSYEVYGDTFIEERLWHYRNTLSDLNNKIKLLRKDYDEESMAFTHAKAELEGTKAELEGTKAELEGTKAEFEEAKKELKRTKTQLEGTKTQLMHERGSMRSSAKNFTNAFKQHINNLAGGGRTR